MRTSTVKVEIFQEYLEYSPHTGYLRWKKAPQTSILPGYRAGRRHQNGHLEVGLKGRAYMAHHIAWYLQYGQWPSAAVIHKNGDKADNRAANLALLIGRPVKGER